MSRPVPPFGDTVRASASLTVVRMRRGRTVWVAAVLAGLLVAVAVLIRATARVEPDTLWNAMLDYPLRRLLVFLVPFLFTSTALSEEIEARTATYLFARPASRAAILLGKYLAGAALAIAIVCGAVAASWAASYVGSHDLSFAVLGRSLGGFALATACYAAMFLCFGVVLVDAPYLLCVLWVGLVELLLSYLPGVVRLVSMSTHLANVVGQTAAEPSVPMLGAWSPEIPAWSSACVLAAVGGAFLLAATSLAGGSELRYGKA